MEQIEVDVLVAGGGTSGVCAGIQAARQGARTLIVEPTPWLGGMLTAAGVTCTDGNHHLPSGLWEEFRQGLYKAYGGPKEVETGWVSNTCFEPHVGAKIFHDLAAAEKNLTVRHGAWPVAVEVVGGRVVAVTFATDSAAQFVVRARITIDATEYGDVMAKAGVEYRAGREAAREYDEPGAPLEADDMIQDITLAACLKDYGPGADKTIPAPPGYNPKNYEGCISLEQDAPGGGTTSEWKKMLDYGRDPNGKYMINWPKMGNDYYLNLFEMTHEQRIEALKKAREFTLGFVHYIQTVGGFKNLGLADDEFDTPDKLAYIPYNRESRRMRGVVTYTTRDVLDPYADEARPLYKTGIAVGDYPLDHHHTKNAKPAEETFVSVPAFSVPYGALVPAKIDGLLVAEHSISVTHMVNGCTRLQPCVMLIGQAAGAAAALCVAQKAEPRTVSVRAVQQALLDANSMCAALRDVPPTDRNFHALQRIALAGVLEGELYPDSWWHNRILIHPDRVVRANELVGALARATGRTAAEVARATGLGADSRALVAKATFVAAALQLAGEAPQPGGKLDYADVPATHPLVGAIATAKKLGWFEGLIRGREFGPLDPVLRRDVAVVIDKAFDPFNRRPVSIG